MSAIGSLPLTGYQSYNFTPPTPPPVSGSNSGFWGNIGSAVTSFGNLGLQIGAAVTKGFSGPVLVPQPQVGATTSTLAQSGVKITEILLFGALALGAVFLLKKK